MEPPYAALDVDHDTLDADSDFFDARLLTVSRQWSVLFKSQFRRFLEEYKGPATPSEAVPSSLDSFSYYQRAALDATRYGLKYIIIHLEHMYEWSEGTHLAAFVQRFFLPLWKTLDKEIDDFVKATLRRYFEQQQPERNGPLAGTTASSDWARLGEEREGDTPAAAPQQPIRFLQDMPVYEKMQFYSLFSLTAASCSVRQLRCETLGELINLRGTATRLSDVRPELRLATFECAQCHLLIDHVEQQFKYTEPQVCPNSQCKNRSAWILRSESCQFSDWQKMRLQENSSEIPAGSMPRVIEVIVTRSLCDRCKPGDKVLITGCLAAVPDVPSLMKPGELPRSVALDRNRIARRTDMGGVDNGITGLSKLGVRDLGYRLLFFALDVKTLNSGLNNDEERNHEDSTDDWISVRHRPSEPLETVMAALGVSPEIQRTFTEVARANDTLDRLAASIAPEIFGCEAVKKGVLTMLVGGVEKSAGKDKMKLRFGLRGDINICIVGDPGTAKSQILKYVHQFAGRAVYAAGNTSTAAGLTVSIHKDPDQGDAVIEAGALMLADKGICCIDEFDKMDGKDMVAIHEAMEQQTISICKAGIQATLNARTSILAACNPRNGRYDAAKPLRHNVRLSAPILSRFDLFFTVLDSVDRDGLVARHVVNLHMGITQPTVESQPYPLLTKEALRLYLGVARSRRPRINAASKQVLVDSYVAMRAECAQVGNRSAARITVRQLESLVRLSEAIAKLKFSDFVLPSHVKEARRLMYSSLMKLEKGTVTLDDGNSDDSDNNADVEGHCTKKQGASASVDSRGVPGATVIDADEFEHIATTIIDRIRSLELELNTQQQTRSANDKENRRPNAASDPTLLNTVEAVVAKDDIVTWYIDNCYDPTLTRSEDFVEREFIKINKVIHRMVNRDFTLIEEERDMYVPNADGTDGTHVERVLALRLHPNLATDRSDYCTGDQHHATLPTTFFEPATLQQSDGHSAQDPSWAIDDQDFMDYMYGWNDAEAP